MAERRLDEMDEAQLRHYCRELASKVERLLPPGPSARGRCLFVLLFTDTCEPGTAQYVANAQREDMIQFLRETADRLERREDNPR